LQENQADAGARSSVRTAFEHQRNAHDPALALIGGGAAS
jgi:hypothetical protein